MMLPVAAVAEEGDDMHLAAAAAVGDVMIPVMLAVAAAAKVQTILYQSSSNTPV